MKKKYAILLLLLSVSTLTGCQKASVDIPLVSALSQQEIIDYYAKALDFSNISSKSNKKDGLVYLDCSEEEKERFTKFYNETFESQLKAKAYNNAFIIPSNQYNSFKTLIDDINLTNSAIKDIKKYQDYYYITVDYDTNMIESGTFNDNLKYLGINGALIENNGNIKLDETFMLVSNTKYQKYLANQTSTKSAILPEITKEQPQEEIKETEEKAEEIEKVEDVKEVNEEKQEQLLTTSQAAPVEEPIEQEETQKETIETNKVEETIEKEIEEEIKEIVPPIKAYRKSNINVGIFNKASGSSENTSAIMPPLSYVYTNDLSKNNICGNGIYPSGRFDLTNFGVNTLKQNGKIEITYVFEKDMLNENKISFNSYYINNYTLPYTNENIKQVPTFVEEEMKILLERIDRVIINKDIAGLFNGNLFEDKGASVLYGMLGKYNYIYNINTKLDKVHEEKQGTYLIEFTRTIELGTTYGSDTSIYEEKYYATIKQQDLLFKLSDFMLVERKCVKTPQPNIESLTQKRLASLNLKGEVSDKSKEEIQKLFDNLYKASTNRTLNDMYACYDDNTILLSSDKKEYFNSSLRNKLVKYGTWVKATYSGNVNEWLGGNNNQVELVCDETITYSNGKTLTMQNYYLVSNYFGKWVIDDVKEIESEAK